MSNIALFNSGMDGSSVDQLSRSLLDGFNKRDLNEGNLDRRPTPRVRTAVPYPEAARSKDLSGYVTLNLLIGEDGNVRNVKVLSASPAGVFEDAAVAAVKNWVFDPAMSDNRRVEVWAKQTIRFNLN